MTTEIDNDRILLALQLRLEMDASLGVGHLAMRKEELEHIAGSIAVENPLPPPRTGKQRPPESQVPLRNEPTKPTPVPDRTASSLPEGYVSLVPFVPPVANPQKEHCLAALRESCMSCQDCELCKKRTNVAWGEGSLDAEVMFIGEGPGRDEDREGRPFVGRSGVVLTDIIEKGMKVSRNQVYIANMVKCRPPGNRDPRPEEVAACSRYLMAQIETIAPRVIVAVGGVAGCGLLGLPPRSPGLRGKWHEFHGVPMRVIFHPSYLLRQRRSENDRTSADRDTWKDILEVMAKLAP